MARISTKIGNEKIEIVDVSLLLLGLDKIKQEANLNLGENKELKKELSSKIDSIVIEKEVKTVNEKINDLSKIISKNPEISGENESGIVAKRIELATEELVRQHPQEVEKLKKEKFKKSFEEETKKINPNLSEEQIKGVEEYSNLVAENSFGKNVLDDYQNEALEVNKELFSPGRLENAWTDLKQTINFLQKSPEEIKGIKEKYNSLKEVLKEINLPGGFKESRSFEKMMTVFNNPNTDQLFSRTKKYLGWADRVDKLTGGWLNKTVTDAGMKMVSKIGNQAVQEFATNALGQIAQLGFKDGATAVLNGILSGGVNAATTVGTTATVGAAGTTAAAAGTAAAGTAAAGAAGTAAVGAAGTTAAVAGGAAISATGVGAIVVAAAAALKVVKNVVDKLAEKLGISTKKFLEENFGKIGGKIIGGVASIVALPAILMGAVSATVLLPILILVFGGLFGYPMMQGNLVSSLVPPKGATEYVEEISDYDSDYDLETGSPSDIIVPSTPINFTRQDLLNVAFSLRKKVTYFWGGEWNHYGNNPDWGVVRKYVYCSDPSKHFTCGTYVLDGLDCSGYVLWIYYQLTGKAISAHYSGAMYQKAANKEWTFVAEENLKPGDIAYRTGHVAIFIGRTSEGDKLFIHSYTSKWAIDITSDTTRYEGKPATKKFDYYLRPNIKFYGE
ncbi:MAG: NlpC/P60 family protein [Candidatus Shapirobacteria bacterium]